MKDRVKPEVDRLGLQIVLGDYGIAGTEPPEFAGSRRHKEALEAGVPAD
jgi:hypothetical protein